MEDMRNINKCLFLKILPGFLPGFKALLKNFPTLVAINTILTHFSNTNDYPLTWSHAA
jgi:hypothetical protein